MEWKQQDGVRWLEAELPGARAAFSTRVGGESAGPFESLNLGLLSGDGMTTVRANRTRLAAALGRPEEGILIGYQVHGKTVVRSERAPQPNPYGETMAAPPQADGRATSRPQLTPLVQVADCLPVALAGPAGVAMIHCGWRGLAGGIVAGGVEEVGATAAAIGPGIGPCCYEVGEEVLGSFAAMGDGVASGRMLDLPEIARRLLAEAGVGAVESSGLCTSCEAELFFSHRRDDGRTGRQGGLVWLQEPAGG
jgi:YfiH family protein